MALRVPANSDAIRCEPKQGRVGGWVPGRLRVEAGPGDVCTLVLSFFKVPGKIRILGDVPGKSVE